MNELTVFNFEGKEVRTVEIDNTPYFIASDICKIFEHSNPSMAIASIDVDVKRKVDPKQYLGSKSIQEIWVVNESGLYSLILDSRKPEAKRFKRWVTRDVLPTIRKTGGYGISSESKLLEIMLNTQNLITQLQIQNSETNSNLIALINNLAIRNEPKIDTPKYFQPSENKPEKSDAHLYHRITFYGKKFRPDLNQEDVRERAKEIGMMASRLSKERKIRIHEEENLDSRYPGKTRYYHQDILNEVFRLIF